jgi:hypothetical protein
MRIAALSVMVICGCGALACAQDENAIAIVPAGFDMESEVDRKLLAFCHGALLRQRGLACTPFAGSSDRWILTTLVRKSEFLEAIDKTPEVASLTDSDARRDSVGVDYIDQLQAYDQSTRELRKVLTADQWKRLSLVYLHTEGMIALLRPQFKEYFESKELRDRIPRLADEAWTKEAADLHRGLFGLRSLDEAPIMELKLRQLSYQLDCRIANLLNQADRQRLVDLISASASIQRVTSGAPAY